MGQIITDREIDGCIGSHRAQGKRIVFTNGCFDILHAGHVYYLKEARSLGDILIVGLNSDSSIRKIKGDDRPIIPQMDRAELLAALGCVDYVVIFDEPTPLRLIESIKPDVLVKGDDWKEEDIVGRDIVVGSGGKVVRIPLRKGISTTAIIRRIVEINR